MKIIVAITGASGAIFGIRLLEALRELKQETHLIVSDWGVKTIETETEYSFNDVKNIAEYFYDNKDLAAAVSSGSFKTDAMVIAPCSMKSLSAIAQGLSINLITRAADVVLKERRKLIMVARETPLSSIHLRNMLTLSETGAVIMPPVPAFYRKVSSLDEMCKNFVGRVIDQLHIENDFALRWS